MSYLSCSLLMESSWKHSKRQTTKLHLAVVNTKVKYLIDSANQSLEGTNIRVSIGMPKANNVGDSTKQMAAPKGHRH